MGFNGDLMGSNGIYWDITSGYDVYIAMVFRWPIEIDGLPNWKMVDLSMANC